MRAKEYEKPPRDELLHEVATTGLYLAFISDMVILITA